MMKSIKKNQQNAVFAAIASLVACTSLAGCGGLTGTSVSAPQVIAGPALRGSVFGGQQPIAGATIYLYAANTTGGYGAATTNLLPAGTVTNVDGTFNITSQYSCTAGQQMYMVSLGGNPGAGTNLQAALLGALGDCASLSASTYIYLNEVTTVGSVFALAPFMSGYAGVGTSPGNISGLQYAFNNANKLININTGVAGGPALAAGAIVPTAEIYTLANVLASCVNSTGGTAGDGSACGSLFAYATPSGGTAPTNTIDLVLMIAKNPALNTANIYPYSAPTGPFSPVLSAAPTDWTMSISYTTGFSAPKSTTVDASGNVWVANSESNKLTQLTQSGSVAQTLSGNGLSAPAAVAIDSDGDAFVANSGGNTVSAFTSEGGVFTGSPFMVGTQPQALAFDASGNLFVANTGSNSITKLTSAGAVVQTVTAGITAPTSIAINPK